MIIIDICLSDLPKDRITVGSNGKKYIKLVVTDRKMPDRYDNDKMVYVSQLAEERKGQVPRIFVGAGKTYKPVETVQVEEVKAGERDLGLPF